MSKIEVNQISSQCGSTLTIGQSGDTVTLACGATAAGFGSTGEVSWDTTKKTTGFTAVSGVGYFCDTTSAAFTVTLPATPSAGNVVAVSDYTGTFGTNNLTIGRNGSNINGSASDYAIYQNNTTAQFIYVDATEGWRLVFTGASSDLASNFIVATGGTITCCGDYKIHTFTGPGSFNVVNTGPGSSTVDYLVIAGGGGGGGSRGGGGGAGGYRESSGAASGCYTVSPLGACVSALPVTVQSYPITVGAGGNGSSNPSSRGCNGNNSVFSSITATAGGSGGTCSTLGNPQSAGNPGGSGGGASSPEQPSGTPTTGPGGSGNTPPVSPPQGNPGGNGVSDNASFRNAGGGGGAGAAASNSPPSTGTDGGNGVTSSINGTPTTRAGGGGGVDLSGSQSGGSGGGGPSGTNGTVNTGSGGGGMYPGVPSAGSGGSGIVIIRYKYQ